MQNEITSIIEEIDGQLVVSHRVIAVQTQVSEENVSRLIRNHMDKLERFGAIGFEIQSPKDGHFNPKPEKTYYLNEQQATLLLTFMRNNEIVKNFKIRLVKEFFQMRELLKSKTSIPQPQISQKEENIKLNFLGLNNAIEVLRPSEASKIKMTEKLYQRLDLETCYFPQYTEEKLTRSLTYLLKKYEIKISTQKANLKLLELGILEKMERDSSCGKTKYFWSLTKKGLEFGKNLISPKNERETQPHFFEDKFLELVELF